MRPKAMAIGPEYVSVSTHYVKIDEARQTIHAPYRSNCTTSARPGPTSCASPSHRPAGRRNPFAGGDQLILKVRVARLRVGRPRPQVEEVLAGHPRRRIIADCEPRLSAMRLVHVVRCTGSTHTRGNPARLKCVGEHVGPKAGGGERQEHVVQLALGIGGGPRPAPA